MLKKAVLAAMTLAALASCGSKNSDTLRVSWWGGDDRHSATLGAIELYKKMHPEVQIKAEYSGWTGHQEKITTQIAGNTAPDLMQINHSWLDIFSRDGTGFYDLNMLSDIIDITGYPTDALEMITINGRLNMIPVSLTGKVFNYNMTRMQELGITPPTSWEALMAAGRRVAENGENFYMLAAGDGDTAFQFLLYYLKQKTGKSLLNSERLINFTEEELIDGFRFLKSLSDNNVLIPIPRIQAAGAIGTVEQMPGWINGNLLGTYSWDSALNKYQQTLPVDSELGIGPFPTLEGAVQQNAATAKIALGFAINKNTKKADMAADLLNFFMNDAEAVKVLGSTRGIPLNEKAVDILRDDGMLSGLPYAANQAVLANIGDFTPTLSEHARFKAFYNELIGNFDYGNLTVEQAAANFISEGNSVLRAIR